MFALVLCLIVFTIVFLFFNPQTIVRLAEAMVARSANQRFRKALHRYCPFLEGCFEAIHKRILKRKLIKELTSRQREIAARRRSLSCIADLKFNLEDGHRTKLTNVCSSLRRRGRSCRPSNPPPQPPVLVTPSPLPKPSWKSQIPKSNDSGNGSMPSSSFSSSVDKSKVIKHKFEHRAPLDYPSELSPLRVPVPPPRRKFVANHKQALESPKIKPSVEPPTVKPSPKLPATRPSRRNLARPKNPPPPTPIRLTYIVGPPSKIPVYCPQKKRKAPPPPPPPPMFTVKQQIAAAKPKLANEPLQHRVTMFNELESRLKLRRIAMTGDAEESE